MAAYSKEFLNKGSTGDGTPIAITGTATAGANPIHSVSGSVVDEVWLWLSNISASDVVATIEFGTATGTQNIDVTVPANSVVLAIPGIPLDTGLAVEAFCEASGSALTAFGYVNRIT